MAKLSSKNGSMISRITGIDSDSGIRVFLSLILGQLFNFTINNFELEKFFTLSEGLTGLLFGVLIFLSLQSIALYNKLITEKELSRYITYLINTNNARSESNDNYIKIITKLYNSKEIIRITGEIALKRFIENFEIEENKISFIGERVSLDAFTALWQYVIKQQRRSKNKTRAFAIHLVSARIWTGANSLKLISLQEKFIKECNGEVYRIFIESPYTDVDIKNYETAMKRMEKVGINTCILRFNNIPDYLFRDFSESYRDFLFFDGSNVITSWIIDKHARRIRSTETNFVDEDNTDLYSDITETWNMLIEEIASYDFDRINESVPSDMSEAKKISDEMISISKKFQNAAQSGTLFVDNNWVEPSEVSNLGPHLIDEDNPYAP